MLVRALFRWPAATAPPYASLRLAPPRFELRTGVCTRDFEPPDTVYEYFGYSTSPFYTELEDSSAATLPPPSPSAGSGSTARWLVRKVEATARGAAASEAGADVFREVTAAQVRRALDAARLRSLREMRERDIGSSSSRMLSLATNASKSDAPPWLPLVQWFEGVRGAAEGGQVEPPP